jgi:uncharacterized protein YndB with AHSA1/START domain
VAELPLTTTRLVSAAPERVFAAWLDPDLLTRFMLPGENVKVPHAETDPRESGRFSIVMSTPEREIPHECVYLEIDPPRRLVFTWKSPMSVDDSRVTVDFVPRGPLAGPRHAERRLSLPRHHAQGP